MPGTFTCHHCGMIFPCNPRIKRQKYCSAVFCQNARHNITTKKKLLRSSESRMLHGARNKRWRDKHPTHTYQNQYRKSHPEYVLSNREQQKMRNNKRQKRAPSMIVKTYAYKAVSQQQQGVAIDIVSHTQKRRC